MKTIQDIMASFAAVPVTEESQQSQTPSTQLVKKSDEAKSEIIVYDYTPEDKDHLNKALGACLAVQRTYGKQAADFEKVVQVFIKVLNEHKPDDVMKAIKKWVMTSPEFPTPADILQILNSQPKYIASYYQELIKRQRNADWLTSEERQYIKDFEENARKGY